MNDKMGTTFVLYAHSGIKETVWPKIFPALKPSEALPIPRRTVMTLISADTCKLAMEKNSQRRDGRVLSTSKARR